MRIRSALFSTLRFKITFFIFVLLFITAAIFSLLSVHTMNQHVLQEVIKRAESLSKSAAALAPYNLLTADVLGTDNMVAKLKDANADIKYIAVIGMDSTVVAHTDISQRGQRHERVHDRLIKTTDEGTAVYEVDNGPDTYFEVVSPILYKNKSFGSVVLGINKSVLSAAKRETQKRIFFGFIATLALGTGCIVVLSSLITRPIKELTAAVAEFKKGRSSKLRVYSNDELGELTMSFNHMTDLITTQQKKLGRHAAELEEAYISTVKVLAAAIDARDPYTLGHSTRVASLSIKIGREMGFSEQELEDLEIECLFHDVGKLKTPDYVLLKEGPLNQEDHREIVRHCEDGAAILGRAPSLLKYIPAVRHHHEWFNGGGYPDGLRGEDIPLHAAIITVADAFDAMISTRPYKNSLSAEDAIQELIRYSGKQFDPYVVQVFLQVIKSGSVVTVDEFSSQR